MNKKGKILFFCMIFVKQVIFAQKNQTIKDNLLLQELTKSEAGKTFPLFSFQNHHPASKPFLSPQFYSSQLGFFCKQEIKFDKITKIPFRFRLGSVEQCDRLEGKGKK
jgi:hypothetical protein